MIYIYIGGMTQCGSTRLFNFIIKGYELSGLKIDSCWCDDLYNKKYNGSVDVLIVKFHDFPKKEFVDLSNFVFLPIRDPRDCVISTNKRFFTNEKKNVGKDIKKMEHNINLFRNWISHTDPKKIFISKYETFGSEQQQNIVMLLNLKLNDDQIKHISIELDNMLVSTCISKRDDKNDDLYKKTLLTQNHNTSGGKSKKYLEYYNRAENRMILMNGKIRLFLKKFSFDLY
jgi:hypothetical protein